MSVICKVTELVTTPNGSRFRALLCAYSRELEELQNIPHPSQFSSKLKLGGCVNFPEGLDDAPRCVEPLCNRGCAENMSERIPTNALGSVANVTEQPATYKCWSP
jgi:hypothetical protein